MSTAGISVVMPAYNPGPFLAAAIDSIAAQNIPHLELILVDDGSVPALHISDFPAWIRCFRQQNSGPAAARNLAIRNASHHFIAFLDADDLWTQGHLERLTNALNSAPNAGIAQGCMQQFWSTPDGEQRSQPYRMPYLGSCLFRRSVLEQVGLLDESMRFGEDYDLLFRCWEQGIRKIHLPEVSLLYRRHPANMTRGNDNLAHLIVIKRRLERQRKGTLSTPVIDMSFQDYIGDLQQQGRSA